MSILFLCWQTLSGLFAQLSGPAPFPLAVLKLPLLVVRKAIWRGGAEGQEWEGWGLGGTGYWLQETNLTQLSSSVPQAPSTTDSLLGKPTLGLELLPPSP